jgi:uroporphyrinogen III methyltransferase/synthase
MNDVSPIERPLLGMRIMVTRPDGPRDLLAELLRQAGADVISQPAIRIAPADDWRPVDAALARLDAFDWLVFSSANGVRHMLDRLRKTGTTRWPATLKVAAIGPGTADELFGYGLSADLVPDQYRAEALAEALAQEAPGRRFLLARASRGREVLAERLLAAGAAVEQIVVYSSIDVESADPAVAALLRSGRIDWITITSSAIARSLVRLFGDDLRRARLASISSLTSGVLRELRYEPTVEAAQYTMAGLAAAISSPSSRQEPGQG